MRVYDPSAPKRATNLSINSDLLAKARALDINLSQTLERELVRLVEAEERRRMQEEADRTCEIWNRFHAEHGSAIDEFREL